MPRQDGFDFTLLLNRLGVILDPILDPMLGVFSFIFRSQDDVLSCSGLDVDFSSIFWHVHRFSSMFIDVASIFIDFHLFSSIFGEFHLFSSIFIEFHRFSMILLSDWLARRTPELRQDRLSGGGKSIGSGGL